MSIRIVLADDHPVILAGAREALAKESSVNVVADAADSTALVAALSKLAVDVAVTDYSMPKGQYGDGVALIGFLRRRFPDVALVVLSGIGGEQMLTSIIKAGVACIVAKGDSIDHLICAIHAAHRGEGYLSPEIARQVGAVHRKANVKLSKREAEVVRLLAEGKSQKAIAEQLERTRQTVSTQKRSAMRKLGLSRTWELFDYAVQEGLVSTSQASRPTRDDEDAK